MNTFLYMLLSEKYREQILFNASNYVLVLRS